MGRKERGHKWTIYSQWEEALAEQSLPGAVRLGPHQQTDILVARFLNMRLFFDHK